MSQPDEYLAGSVAHRTSEHVPRIAENVLETCEKLDKVDQKAKIGTASAPPEGLGIEILT
jgi:hypothetical protein